MNGGNIMSIFKVTLTGVDEQTDLNRLWELADQYPFAEFGILYSLSNQGSGRYPTLNWLDNIVKRAESNPIPLALHVCGSMVRHLLNNTDSIDQIHIFERIQLNFVSRVGDQELLSSLCDRFKDHIFITQHFPSNNMLHTSKIRENHSILFDTSGGRGIIRKEWPNPFDSVVCGYAGGLGPDNLKEQLPLIEVASQGKPFWIDMESNLRTEDKFDLNKVEQVLEICHKYMDAAII